MRNVTYKGKSAVTGICKCGRQLIITMPKSKGEGFESFHAIPSCAEYDEIVKNAEANLVAISAEDLK